MKRLLFLSVFMMGLGCFNLRAQNVKDNQDTKEQVIQEMVQNKEYIISCDRMYPLRGSSKYVGGNYSVEIKNDTVRSYLPYQGVAHSASYGGGNVLDFEKVYTEYQLKEEKKGKLLVSFRVENENESMKYQLTIYPNGKADIHIQPMKRDAISYTGELEMDEESK